MSPVQNARTITSPIKGDGGIRTAQSARPFVHVLADSSDKLSGICSALEQQFAVAGERLDAEARLSQAPFAIVIRAELRDVDNIAAIKKRSARLAKAAKRIFLVEHSSHVCISQAYALGATLVLPGPLNKTKLLAALADPVEPAADSSGGSPRPDNAVETAATAIASMFTAVTLGQPLTSTAPRKPDVRLPTASPSMACRNGSRRYGATMREPISTACS